MADARDGTIAAFAGMENSIAALRSLTLLLANMEQDRSALTQDDGTCHVIFDDRDEMNAQAFLILNIEERTVALIKEFEACLDVWKTGCSNV